MYARTISRLHPAIAARWATLLIGVAIAGCSDDPRTAEVTDVGQLRGIVADLAGASQDNSDRFESLFVDGAAPTGQQRSQYAPPLAFRLEGDPDISGDSATFTVKVSRQSDDPMADSPQPIGEKKWTARRVGDQWKLQAAPLP